jgi:CRISPR-associated endonuclease Csn1
VIWFRGKYTKILNTIKNFQMERRLGLDIGTNSIGWAIIDCEVGQKQIVDIGQYIFPMGRDDSKQITKAEERRGYRATRRGYMRHRLSRDGSERGRTPGLIPLLIQHHMMPPHNIIEIENHRKYILDDRELWAAHTRDGGPFSTNKFDQTRFLFALRAKAPVKEISLEEFGRLILWFNRRRGWRKTKGESDEREESQEANDKKKALSQMSRLEEQVHAVPGRTLGQYFNELMLEAEVNGWHAVQDEIKSIRRRFVHRRLYEQEFDTIWAAQSQFHESLHDNRLRIMIRDAVLFYQRPLKSQKHLVRECPLFPPKKCIPRSDLMFQHFRVLQQLVNVRLPGNERLTTDQISTLFDVLEEKEEMTLTELKDQLGMSRGLKFFELPRKENSKKPAEQIYGNKTRCRLIAATSKAFIDALAPEALQKLVHALHSTKAGSETKLQAYLAAGSVGPISAEFAASLSEVELESGYGRLSKKAIGLMLSRMFMGSTEIEARIALRQAGVLRERQLPKAAKLSRMDALGRDALARLPNPVVRRSLGSMIRLTNDVIRRYGPIHKIHIELARPVTMTAKQREEYSETIKANRDDRERVKRILLDHGVDDSQTNIRNYQLLEEIKFCCLYCGNPINLGHLFHTGDAQLEHIHPRSISSERNKRRNLTIAHLGCNQQKGQQNPHQYFSSRPIEAKEFQKRVSQSALSQGKKRWFLLPDTPKGNAPGQSADTGYTARLAKPLLKQLNTLRCERDLDGNERDSVWSIGGGYTAALRYEWGLNSLIHPEGLNVKFRGDHRHHAIDAVVIAVAEPWMVERIASTPLTNGAGDQPRKYDILPPTGLRLKLDELLPQALTVWQSQTRLVGKRPNSFMHREAEGQKKLVRLKGFAHTARRSFAVRQGLHDNNYLGIRPNDQGGFDTVTRYNNALTDWVGTGTSLSTVLSRIDAICDPTIRGKLRERVQEIENESGFTKVKEFLGNPAGVVLTWRDSVGTLKIVHVRKVMCKKGTLKEEEGVHMRVRRHLDTKKERFYFAVSNNNYSSVIYGPDATGRNQSITLPFHQVVRAKLSRSDAQSPRLFSPTKSSLPLRYTLRINDMLVTYESGPDEINFENRRDLFSRLCKVRQTGSQIWIDRHSCAKKKKEMTIGTDYFRPYLSKLKASKVRFSPSGEILRIHN